MLANTFMKPQYTDYSVVQEFSKRIALKMPSVEESVYLAKLAEQAERYEGQTQSPVLQQFSKILI